MYKLIDTIAYVNFLIFIFDEIRDFITFKIKKLFFSLVYIICFKNIFGIFAGIDRFYHHVVPLAQISLNLSRHSSSLPVGFLDYIHCPYRIVFKYLLVVQHLHVRVKGSMGKRRLWVRRYSSSNVLPFLFEQFLRWEIGGRFVRCSFQDLFNLGRSILGPFPSSFLSICSVSIQGVHPYCRTDRTTAW